MAARLKNHGLMRHCLQQQLHHPHRGRAGSQAGQLVASTSGPGHEPGPQPAATGACRQLVHEATLCSDEEARLSCT
jgi:hypothetical protein